MVETTTLGLGEKGRIIDALITFMADLKYVQEIPDIIKSTIRSNAWKEFKLDNGVHAKHETFESFVTTAPLEGLGTNVRHIKNICRDDAEALDAIDRVMMREAGDGKNQHTKCLDNNVNEAKESRPTGNTRSAALRRLRKDRPDLHAKVIAGELSAHRAMVEAGFRRVKSNLEKIKDLYLKLSDDELRQLDDFHAEYKKQHFSRLEQVKAGLTVVANMRKGADTELIDWAKKNKKYIRIDRKSPFGNPFIIGTDGDRDAVCDKYEEYFTSRPDLVKRIFELKGMVLGCWCYPERCHGSYLARLANA